MPEVSPPRPAAEIANTYNEHNVTLHKVRRGDRGERRVPDDSARGWYHRQEGREDSLGLLELIELDERVEEGHADEDAAEVRILEVVLWEIRQPHQVERRRVCANLEVDAEQNILKDAGNDEDDVEHSCKAIKVLVSGSAFREPTTRRTTYLAERGFFLGGREDVGAIAGEPLLRLLRGEAVRGTRVFRVDAAIEGLAELVEGQMVLIDVDPVELVLLALVLLEVFVPGRGEFHVFLGHLAFHFHTLGAHVSMVYLLFVDVVLLVWERNGACVREQLLGVHGGSLGG